MSIESGFSKPKPKAEKNYPAEKQEPQVSPATEPSIDRSVHQQLEQGHGEDGGAPISAGSQPTDDTSNPPPLSNRERLDRLMLEKPNQQQEQNSELANNLSDDPSDSSTQQPQDNEVTEVNPTSNQNLADQLEDRSESEPIEDSSSESPSQSENNSANNSELANDLQDSNSAAPEPAPVSEPSEPTDS